MDSEDKSHSSKDDSNVTSAEGDPGDLKEQEVESNLNESWRYALNRAQKMFDAALSKAPAPKVQAPEIVAPGDSPPVSKLAASQKDFSDEIHTLSKEAEKHFLSAVADLPSEYGFEERYRRNKKRRSIPTSLERKPFEETRFLLIIESILISIWYFYSSLFKLAELIGINEVEKCFYGFVLMFCGADLHLTIILCEVVYQTGAERVRFNIKLMKREYDKIAAANEKDNKEDLDGDNIPDVKQIPFDQLVFRKLLLTLRTCDPEIISRLLQASFSIFVSFLAALKSIYIRCITLGVALADVIFCQAVNTSVSAREFYRDPKAVRVKEWQNTALKSFMRLCCIAVACTLSEHYFRFYYALKGAYLMSKGLTEWAERNGHYELTDGYADEIFSGILGLMGLYTQYSHGEIHFLIWVFLLPLYRLEYILRALV